jgi:hypothetical protein
VWAAFGLLLCCSAADGAFTCAAGEDATTCAALGDLYNATDGPHWVNNGGWSDAAASIPTSYCSFARVNCEGGIIRYLCVVAFANECARRYSGSVANPSGASIRRALLTAPRRTGCSGATMGCAVLSPNR